MATEKELGYEPSLLIEMLANSDDGKTINTAVIQKDRADKINGQEIPMPNYQKLKAHFDSLNIGGQHFDSMEQRNSTEMYDVDEQGWDKEKLQREIAAEEILELLKKYYPSQSVEDKQARSSLLENVFNTRSWKAIENMHSNTLRSGLLNLRHQLEPKQDELKEAANG